MEGTPLLLVMLLATLGTLLVAGLGLAAFIVVVSRISSGMRHSIDSPKASTEEADPPDKSYTSIDGPDASVSDSTAAAAWLDFADQHGLECNGSRTIWPTEIKGRYQGRQLRIVRKIKRTEKHKYIRTIIQVRLATGTVRGWQVRREQLGDQIFAVLGKPDVQVDDERLDDLLHIWADDRPETQAILTSPDVREAILRSAGGASQFAISDDTVTVGYGRWLHSTLQDALDRVGDIARALEVASAAGWETLRKDHGFSFHYNNDTGGRTAEGRIGTIQVHVDYLPSESGGRTSVEAILPPTITPTLQITRCPVDDPGIPLDDPILDGQIAVTGMDADQAQELLCRDAVRGDLMQVVCGWGGRIESGRVRVERSGMSSQFLAAWVSDVVSLATALSASASS